MIIFLYGPDSYRRQEKLKEYVERYKAKYKGLSLSNFYLDQEADWEKLKDFSKSQSLFESSKLGVIFNSGDLEAKYQKEFAAILKDNLESKNLTLIINADKKLTKDLAFLLKKPAISLEFENLTGEILRAFLKKEARNRNLILDKPSEDLLMRVYAGNAWGLITELEKLSLLDENKITAGILESHLNAFLPENIYYFINQIRNSRRASDRLSALEELFMRSEEPGMIFNLLSAFVKTSAEKQKAADYDAAVKSGKLEYEEALTDLAISDSTSG